MFPIVLFSMTLSSQLVGKMNYLGRWVACFTTQATSWNMFVSSIVKYILIVFLPDWLETHQQAPR